MRTTSMPDDVGVDAARRLEAEHLGAEAPDCASTIASGMTTGAQDLLAVVDVVQEGVERAHALLEPAREAVPLAAAEHARNDVEGDQPLGIAALGVDREGDADAAEEQLGLAPAQLELGLRGLRQPVVDQPIGRADRRPTRASRRSSACPPPPGDGAQGSKFCAAIRSNARAATRFRQACADRETGSERPHRGQSGDRAGLAW